MNVSVKNTIYRTLYLFRMGNIYNFFVKKNNVVILAYHRVDSIDDRNILLKEMIVEPDRFEEQIGYLSKSFSIISLEDFAKDRARNEKVAIITFDDAYLDNYEHAYPILKKFNVPATVFIPTAFIETNKHFYWDEISSLLTKTRETNLNFVWKGKTCSLNINTIDAKQMAFKKLLDIVNDSNEEERKDFFKKLKNALNCNDELDCPETMTWEQMREMKKGNISFGAHTHNHFRCSKIDQNIFLNEIAGSKKIIDDNLRQDTSLFAYPFGGRCDMGSSAEVLLKRSGYICAVTMEQGLVNNNNNKFRLKRVGIGGNDSPDIFELKLFGLVPAMSNLKRLIKCKLR